VTQPLPQTWDLDVFFPGGSASPEFDAFLASLRDDIASLQARVAGQGTPRTAAAALATSFKTMQELSQRLQEAAAFTACLVARDVKDSKAYLLDGRVEELGAGLRGINILLNQALQKMPDAAWAAFQADPIVQPIAFVVRERRDWAKELLPTEQEGLANALSADGYHAWGKLYDTITGRITVTYEHGGETHRQTPSQAFNRWMFSPNRAERAAAFGGWEPAWGDAADLCARALNHAGGFRLALYRARGWESVLKEPLHENRIGAASLEAMWDVIDRNKAPLVAFLQRKAQLIGAPALHWYDLYSPLPAAEHKLDYDAGAAFVLENFGRFSPGMADLTYKAFHERWVEAENRPNKGAGAYCTTFGLTGEPRVFMTYDGNVTTLAHELGHAYHAWVVRDLAPLAADYTSALAETASNFAETIVAEAAIAAAQNPAERRALLLERCTAAVAHFMNLPARFHFELDFFAARRSGPLSVGELDGLMLAAQQKAYGNALAGYEPHFWASKLHFYLTGQPFYNFPYVIGYLFSSGIYARAQAEGPRFAHTYVELLRDMGRMTTEQLVAKHLGADLTRPDFWQSAVDRALAPVQEFLRVTA